MLGHHLSEGVDVTDLFSRKNVSSHQYAVTDIVPAYAVYRVISCRYCGRSMIADAAILQYSLALRELRVEWEGDALICLNQTPVTCLAVASIWREDSSQQAQHQ